MLYALILCGECVFVLRGFAFCVFMFWEFMHLWGKYLCCVFVCVLTKAKKSHIYCLLYFLMHWSRPSYSDEGERNGVMRGNTCLWRKKGWHSGDLRAEEEGLYAIGPCPEQLSYWGEPLCVVFDLSSGIGHMSPLFHWDRERSQGSSGGFVGRPDEFRVNTCWSDSIFTFIPLPNSSP